MPTFKGMQEVTPGNQQEVEVEAADEEEAKRKLREEHGGYTVGQLVSEEDEDEPSEAQPAHSGQASQNDSGPQNQFGSAQ